MWAANSALSVHQCLVTESEVQRTFLRKWIIDRVLSQPIESNRGRILLATYQQFFPGFSLPRIFTMLLARRNKCVVVYFRCYFHQNTWTVFFCFILSCCYLFQYLRSEASLQYLPLIISRRFLHYSLLQHILNLYIFPLISCPSALNIFL